MPAPRPRRNSWVPELWGLWLFVGSIVFVIALGFWEILR